MIRRVANHRYILIAALCGFVLALRSSPLLATEIFFPGVQPKLAAGAGQTVSRGSSALFYNPANAIYSKFIEPYADVSFANISYTYQHTDTEQYAPAVIAVNSPLLTVGLTFRPWPSFSMGVAALPTGMGAVQLIEAVPTQVTPSAYQAMDIARKDTSYKLAAGAAYRFAHPLTVGLGLIHSSEQSQLLVTPVDAEDPFLDALYAGTANQFIVGARSELMDRALVLGLSYKTAATKVYQGNILVNLSPEAEPVDFEGAGYLPAALGFGAEARFGSVGFFFDYVLEMWSAGRLIAKRGFPSDAPETDLVDTNNISAGMKWWVAPKHMLQGGVGLHSANVAEGTENFSSDDVELRLVQDDEDIDRIGGVAFGNLEAIPRMIVAGGYRYKLTGHGYLETGAHFETGTRIVPEGFDGEGAYSLRVIVLTFGMAFGF